MAIRVVEFSNGGYKIRKKRRAVKKCPNLTFKVNFLCQKSSESFSIFFSLKNTNLGAHFLLLTFFDKINF